MPSTYQPIATASPTSGSTVTFDNIPGTFTDLILQGTIATTGVINPTMRFNGDTGSNYSATWVAGSGSATSSSRNSNATFGFIGAAGPSNTFAPHIIQINNYSNTTTNKTYISRNGLASGISNQAVAAWVGLWRNTGAITSITITFGVESFAAGTVLTLYGIKAA